MVPKLKHHLVHYQRGGGGEGGADPKHFPPYTQVALHLCPSSLLFLGIIGGEFSLFSPIREPDPWVINDFSPDIPSWY
jgi:hypothetical protein